MTEREYLDLAPLYHLDLLDEQEEERFERELRVNPHLREAVKAEGELAARVALTVPQHQPAARNWERIEKRIGQTAERRILRPFSVRSSKPLRTWLPWAAAAGFAVLAAWMAWRSYRAEDRLWVLEKLHGSSKEANRHEAGSGGTVEIPPGPRDTALASAKERTRQAWLLQNDRPDASLLQDVTKLQAALERLRAENQTPPPPPGVADMRLLEMRPPGAAKPEEQKKLLLPERMAEAIATGLETERKPKDELRLSGHGASPTQDIYVDQGMVNLNALNLHPDAQVVHRNFPKDEEFGRYGLTRMDDTNVWDGQGWMWHRAENGSWIGQRVPEGWHAPDPEDPQPVAPPPLRPPPATEAQAQTEPYALPIVDSSSGMGRLIVQDLPPAPDGQAYHLWMIDPASSEPIQVGALPAMNSANDHFSFELGRPGVLPSGYLLTLEKPGHTGSPAGKVVLRGP